MTQTIQPIITEAGKIWGRDAIFLDQVRVINESTFELVGEFNGNLCENLMDDVFHEYQIQFSGVLLFKMTELDFHEAEYHSSFDEIINSEQVRDLIQLDKKRRICKIDDRFRHFVFSTYDTVFEIIGREFKLKLSQVNSDDEESQIKPTST